MPGERFVIDGGYPLEGSVRINGAKNAALPCMAAALLTAEECVLENVPHIDDVTIMSQVLASLGMEVEWVGDDRLRLKAAHVTTTEAPSHLVVKNRASFLVMGALLGRFGEAACSPPGGDVIGMRPIDVHLVGFRSLGAEVSRRDEKYRAQAKELTGAQIFMDYPSNMGTENLIMAACLAKGETIIKNAACEPEVSCLSDTLNLMGAKITGAGTNTIHIQGVPELHGCTASVIPDRIEAGTYAIAAAISGGDVTLCEVRGDHLDALVWKLREAGVVVDVDERSIRVKSNGSLSAVTIQALPYPGFATDLQSTLGVLLTQAHGVSVIHERVYDNRLLYVGELRRMGAEVVVAGQTAIITGPTRLVGTPVRALDIRCGAALVLAGLVAEGRTEIYDIYHLDRGYQDMDQKLRCLGAKVVRQPTVEREPF
ncbi:MAG: murA1 [Dehalococcoidia bacterium]|nr:murA1 [Dehalococcoidia bacterium]